MRKQTRWIVGAVLGLVAIYLAMGSLLLEPVTPAHAQTSCTPNGSVAIVSISPSSVYNSGPTVLTVIGTGFDATSSVVVLGFGALATDTTNAPTTLTATLPAGVPGTPGGSRYGILVYNTSGADPNGDCDVLNDGLIVYTVPTVPAPTAAPTAFIRPLVSVLSYGASSKVLYPGQNVDFELTLQNTGPIVAKNVVVEFSGNDLLPRDTGGLRAPGDIAAGGTLSFLQPLKVSSSLGGYQAVITIKISYTDEYGAKYSDNSTLSFDAGQYAAATATLSMSPQLILSSYETTPAVLSPGTVFQLDLNLANVSGKVAHQITVDLGTGSSSSGSSSGSAASAPVAPQNSSNLRYIEAMQPGQQEHLSFDMAVSGDASSELANLELAISYIDDSNEEHSQTENISLRIETQALLLIHFFNELPDLLTVGDIIELPVEVINIGQNDLNVSIVEVTSDQMSITGGTIYFGPLSGGTSGTLIAEAQLAQAGTATLTVTVNYLDDFQQPQVYTQEMTLEIEAKEIAPEGSGDGTGPGSTGAGTRGGDFGGLTLGQRLLRMLLGFFGIGTQSIGGGGMMQSGGNFGGADATPPAFGDNAP